MRATCVVVDGAEKLNRRITNGVEESSRVALRRLWAPKSQ